MRQRILIGLALVLVVIGILYLLFAQPDEARLSVTAVTGRKPDITTPRQQICRRSRSPRRSAGSRARRPPRPAG
jgi:uncharacterized protein YjeT (DUF2065 family)